MSEDIGNTTAPEIFIVSSEIVKDTCTWHHKVPLFKILKGEEKQFKDRWDLILYTLKAQMPSETSHA